MSDIFDPTLEFSAAKDDAESTIQTVCDALTEKGYDASNQIVGYLISGDPGYITSYKDARNLIQNLDRDELMDLFVRYYLNNVCK